MAILGLSREQAAWDTPVVTILRLRAAYIERNGKSVNWDPTRMDRILERMEALTGGDQS